MPPRAPRTFLALASLAAPALSMGNGAVALAFPVRAGEAIVPDGRLDDWPEGLPRYRLERAYFGNPPADPADFRGEFRLAYDPDAALLYVAVEVEDEAHLVEAEGRSWWDDDGCVLFLDRTHSPLGSGAVALGAAGSRRELSGNTGIHWDPAVAAGSWDGAEAAVLREGTRTVYEWAVEAGRPLAPGVTLGFDLAVIDLDEGEPDSAGSYVTWGPGVFRERNAGRCGAVVMVESPRVLGTLRGRVEWEGGAPNPMPECVRVRAGSGSGEPAWLDAALDAEGRFELRLPAGNYSISPSVPVLETDGPPLRIADGCSVSASVEADATAQAEPLVLRAAPEPDLLEAEGVLHDWTDDDAGPLDRFVEAWMDHYRIPGVALAVVKDGAVVHRRSYGVANALTGEPLRDESLLEGASVTKCLFAFAVLRLAERGVIDLDRELHLDLPFPALAHDPRYERLTPRIVLSHRSGLPNWGDGDRIDLRFLPGTAYGYSGEAFEYLGRVVSHLDGRSLEQILAEEVLEPMGLRGGTCFKDGPDVRRRAARGHWTAGPTRGDISAEVGVAHSMFTSAGDLASFLKGLLAEEGLSYPAYADMLGFEVDRPAGEIAPGLSWRKGFGLGFMLMESPFGLVFGHDGNNGDFRSNLEAYRDLDAGYAVLVNHDFGGLLSDRLREYLVIGGAGGGG